MSKEPIEFLKHISDESSYLKSVSEDLSKDEFLDDETLKKAVVRSLEVIGEATVVCLREHKEGQNDT